MIPVERYQVTQNYLSDIHPRTPVKQRDEIKGDG